MQRTEWNDTKTDETKQNVKHIGDVINQKRIKSAKRRMQYNKHPPNTHNTLVGRAANDAIYSLLYSIQITSHTASRISLEHNRHKYI